MEFPISESIVAVVSIAATYAASRFIERNKSKKDDREKRQKRIRLVVASLSELESDLISLEIDFEEMDNALPNLSRYITPFIRETIDLDEPKIKQWEKDFESALASIKTLDVALYMRLFEEKKEFRSFFSKILVPYLIQYRPVQEEKPELISITLRAFLADLRETILELSKELPKRENKEITTRLGHTPDPNRDGDMEQRLEIFSLLADLIPIQPNRPIDESDFKWLDENINDEVAELVLDHLLEFIEFFPELLERLFFGSVKSLITPMMKGENESLSDWINTYSKSGEEVEKKLREFQFSQDEEKKFIGNNQFYHLILSIAGRFEVEIPFKYKRYMVALKNGWISPNQLIEYFRDDRIPIVPYNVNHTIPFLPSGYDKTFGSSIHFQLYLEQRQRLDNYLDRIFYHPLSELEIMEIEAGIGYPFPPYFRDFLFVFGIKQDILPWIIWAAGSISIPHSLLPAEDRGRYFAIGRMSDYGQFFISFSFPDHDIVYKLEYGSLPYLVHYGSFSELLVKAVDDVISNYGNRRLNTDKIRKVEFHFYANEYDDMITPILEFLKADDLPTFEFFKVKDDIAIWKTNLEFDGRTLELQRLESFDSNEYPKYFLMMTEPISDLKSKSFVDFIYDCYSRRNLKMKFLEYDFRIQVIEPSTLND